MDVVERLTIEDARAPTLLALTHVHRYRLAAEICAGMRTLDLCCGSGYGSAILAEQASSVTGADIDGESIARASGEFGDRENLCFQQADAHELLASSLRDTFDAIVLLEGLEHLPDPQRAVEQLRRHADEGLTLVVSLPNSKAFDERNPHHVTDFDYEEASAAAGRLGESPVVLHQYHAEGSLIRRGDESLRAELAYGERAEPEYCNHLIAVVNAPHAAAGVSARMQLAVAPTFNRYMTELERFNRQLWRTNQRLARQRIGQADSAAAAALSPTPREAPAALEAIAGGIAKILRGLATVVLTILPHGLTLLLLRVRARLRADRPA